jgi:hypothetical protein
LASALAVKDIITANQMTLLTQKKAKVLSLQLEMSSYGERKS